MPSMDLYQSHKQKRISDTNKWIYTNLLKKTMIPDSINGLIPISQKQNKTKEWISDANNWSYSNLPKENKIWMSDANLSGLTPTSKG